MLKKIDPDIYELLEGVLWCCVVCLCFFCFMLWDKMTKVEGSFVWAGLVFEDFWVRVVGHLCFKKGSSHG